MVEHGKGGRGLAAPDHRLAMPPGLRYYDTAMPTAPRNADDEWLIGLRAIALYMGRSERTIRRWIDDHGFPAGMTPSGHWIASKQSIRDWVLVRGRQVVEQRRMERQARMSGVNDHGRTATTA